MKTTDSIIADMEAALADHEREAARLRTMIAAARGEPVKAAPAALTSFVPPVPWLPITQPWAPPGVIPGSTWPYGIHDIYVGDVLPDPHSITCGSVTLGNATALHVSATMH